VLGRKLPTSATSSRPASLAVR